MTPLDDTKKIEIHKKKVIYQISTQYDLKVCRRKVRKTMYFQYTKYKRGKTPTKNSRKLTTLKVDLIFIKRKSYTQFQLNKSKHVGEKCEKLCISSILSSERGITPTEID